jgi:glutathionylspermidine synthase
MKRVATPPRKDWERKVEEVALIFHTAHGVPYWDESAYFELNERDVAKLEAATNELHARCLDATQNVIDQNRFEELHLSKRATELAMRSWQDDPPSIYGRFDLAYDGLSEPKLLEYNADTPTSLLEAGAVQWHWLEDMFPGGDQFNSIHERLIAAWTALRPYISTGTVHFASTEDAEDVLTTAYMRDLAAQSGLETVQLTMEEIGYNAKFNEFRDLSDAPIATCFKLYPWEWMVKEKFGADLIPTYEKTQWIEPAWKQILSNKGILAILWELFPDHPNLLPASFHPLGQTYVKKPLLSREGANISIVERGKVTTQGADHGYGREASVYQALAPVFRENGSSAVVGSWVVQGQSAGIGIREATGSITDNFSRFVPHIIS